MARTVLHGTMLSHASCGQFQPLLRRFFAPEWRIRGKMLHAGIASNSRSARLKRLEAGIMGSGWYSFGQASAGGIARCSGPSCASRVLRGLLVAQVRSHASYEEFPAAIQACERIPWCRRDQLVRAIPAIPGAPGSAARSAAPVPARPSASRPGAHGPSDCSARTASVPVPASARRRTVRYVAGEPPCAASTRWMTARRRQRKTSTVRDHPAARHRSPRTPAPPSVQPASAPDIPANTRGLVPRTGCSCIGSVALARRRTGRIAQRGTVWPPGHARRMRSYAVNGEGPRIQPVRELVQAVSAPAGDSGDPAAHQAVSTTARRSGRSRW